MFAIEVEGLRKSYGKDIAVQDVSFKIRKGEIFGLLGPNGAGKSTTINMITGLLTRDAGTIKILGSDPEKDWERIKNKMGVATAYYPLNEILTIRQNLIVYSKIYNIQNANERINSLLKDFGLEHLANKRIGHLSSGERTRTTLCKGLLPKPEILFLDECTIGLDPDIAQKTRQMILDYHNETKCTILFTSHYMFEVEQLCDRIAFLDKGRILYVDTSKELKAMIKKEVIQLTLKSNTEKLSSFLRKKSIRIISVQESIITFELQENKETFQLLKEIFNQDFDVIDMHISKPTLDDIFIHIARNGK
ncbi:ABC transporter ATP-binding protein [Candidatus Woesearchaeota archaeon]|nr:MAG: antibiotic transport system ATP-binding protein [archaeon GW2011_AR4]MBS3129297.1 ABC transporter ATP-binding protein [Candidatus Woesearchaeota archaeon]HIH38600.1 ABC transporter ATP-binding protein [Candidatus Woesearchaeota archaeon]HIH48605.1 ABC transporter ATP-binding protein [Candidatus Woesearchaeota archaeon]HIJ02804.1 ABC transporter ATP-binding protein [Candidatus Woesearchaeota archaeon]